MFFEIFTRVLAIFLIIFLGAIARKNNFLTAETTSKISLCVTNFFYPALIISSITSNFSAHSLLSHLVLPAGTIIIMTAGYITGMIFLNFLTFESDKQKNTFLFQSTINNYFFLPLPIIAMFFGDKGVAYLVFSSLGSEISVWTIGILGLTGNQLGKKSLKNLISVPIISLILSIAIVFLKDSFVLSSLSNNKLLKTILIEISGSIEMFGKATVPLALFTAGSRMSEFPIQKVRTQKILWIVFLRLIFIPALSCAILTFLRIEKEIFFVLAIVAIMPSAIASIILSDTYNADIEFASSSVLATHIVSLFTIPAWLTFLMR